MRWLVYAFLIAGCDQGERTPPPARAPSTTANTYGAESFIELEAQSVSDMPVPRDWRRIKISGDGTLADEREHQETRHRQIPTRRFAEIVQELEKARFLKLSGCMHFDHGRHTTLTLSVPEGHNQISDAATCDVLREPIRHILELAD